MPYPLIILAAGASTRMGRAKQLLEINGETLLHRVIRIGRQAGFGPIVVVTGARQAAIYEALEGEPAVQAHNPDWESGMGSSVCVGLEAALEEVPDAAAAGFVLTDQPYVSVELLSGMQSALEGSGAPGIAAAYAYSLGVPAIFRKALFSELRQLKGQKGAKPLLLKHAGELIAYPFPRGQIDLDTPADWQAFKKQ